jgi:hypothetical protein
MNFRSMRDPSSTVQTITLATAVDFFKEMLHKVHLTKISVYGSFFSNINRWSELSSAFLITVLRIRIRMFLGLLDPDPSIKQK